MKNVTITLDEKTAAWVRVYTARHDTSVSRIVGEMLNQRMHSQARGIASASRPISSRLSAGRHSPARNSAVMAVRAARSITRDRPMQSAATVDGTTATTIRPVDGSARALLRAPRYRYPVPG